MITTPNIGLAKPIRGSQRWDININANSDNIDTHIGGLNNNIDDLPEVERHAGTFNASTGTVVTLSKTVDAVNEYGVEIVPTSRAAAIGDVWVTKGTSSFTVHCSGSNTSDTFEAIVFHTGDMTSYGGSMYRRYYVSPSTSITDHSVASTVGSLAYILNQMSGTSGIVELPGNRIYTLTANDVTIPAGIRLLPQPGAVISIASGKTLTVNGSISAGAHQIFSGSGTLVFGTGSIEKAYVQWTGALGDGSTDCGASINQIASACRANAIPVYFPPGDYLTTSSLNFTGANDLIAGHTAGWIVFGAGQGASRITGNLSSGYPIVDFVESHTATLRDIQVYGHASGSQICGVLHSKTDSYRAGGNRIINSMVNGTYSEAGYINVSSDLPFILNSYILGPCGAIFTRNKDALGVGIIQSAYKTLTTDFDGTYFTIDTSGIEGTGGDSKNWDASIVFDEWGTGNIDSTYVPQTGTAKAGIVVDNSAGNALVTSVYFSRSRYENQTGSGEGTFVWVETDTALRNCKFDGYIGGLSGGDAGQIFRFEGGGIESSEVRISSDFSGWDNFVTRNGSSHSFKYCQFFESNSGTLNSGADAAIFGVGNVFHLVAWNASWMNVPTGNLFYTGSDNEGSGIVDRNHLGWHAVGKTNTLARRFVGLGDTAIGGVLTSAASGDEELRVFTLPGDIASANITKARVKAVFTAWGYCAGNTNAKTIKGKFGQNGSETTIIYNDQTPNPNASDWKLVVTMWRVDLTNWWTGFAEMVVGNVSQSFNMADVVVDPSAVVINFTITGDAAANDIGCWGATLEYF